MLILYFNLSDYVFLFGLSYTTLPDTIMIDPTLWQYVSREDVIESHGEDVVAGTCFVVPQSVYESLSDFPLKVTDRNP